MEELNANQKKASEYNGRHLLVLAGAGTGKTKTIVARASYLLSKGVEPNKIQILTFTKKSALEIVSRVEESANSQGQRVNGSTFHAWCNHLLMKFPRIFGLKNFTIMDQDDQVNLMKLVCGKSGLVMDDVRVKPQKLLDIYSFLRNKKTNLTNAINSVVFNDIQNEENKAVLEQIKPTIEQILREYQQKKSSKHYLDFDDILMIVANRLNKDKEACKLIANEYQHILVDEMQDTNPLQWDLLNPLAEYSSLFCVGDDAQSIYAFRGADFENIHKFKERVQNSEVFKLEDNYRSTQEILDLSNWLLKQSPLDYDKSLKAFRGGGNMPEIINVENDWEEANFIADKIIENYTNNNKIYIDHLVLARSQFATLQVQAVFLERKIPFVVYGGRKFMESAHIKDVFSPLRSVNNFQDDLAWIRFLTFWPSIGEKKATMHIDNLQKATDFSGVLEYWEAQEGVSEKKITQILKDIYSNIQDLSKAVLLCFSQMEDVFKSKYSEDWENKRKADFPVLEVLAGKYRSLNEFISELLLDSSPTLQRSLNEESNPEDHVIISTIHSAKGLEADTAFVIRVSPGVYPSSMSLGDEKEIEEERRVLYVALTRAKNHLYILRSQNSVYGEMSGTLPLQNGSSYFLNNLPETLVKQNAINKPTFKISDKGDSDALKIDDYLDWS